MHDRGGLQLQPSQLSVPGFYKIKGNSFGEHSTICVVMGEQFIKVELRKRFYEDKI